MKRYISCVLAVLMALSMLLTACGSSETPAADGATGSTGSTADGAAEGEEPQPVTFRFQWWGSDARHEATLAVIDQYMKENPHVTIEAEYRGKSDREKVATELVGNQLADLVQLDYDWLGDFTTAGDYFVDLNTLTDIIDMSGFDMEFARSYGEYNGKLIALPTGLNANANIINKTLAEQFDIPTGMDTQWTWEDYLEIGKTVHEKDANKYFLNADSVTLYFYVLSPYLQQLTGKEVVGDDYTLGFTAEELTQALDYIGKLYEAGVVLPASEANVFLENPWTNPKWINGDFVTELSLTSTMPAELQDMPGEGSAFILPMMENAKASGITVYPSQLLGISKECECVEEVAKFMNYFYNSEEAGVILKDCRAMPPVEKIRNLCAEQDLLNPAVVQATEYAMANPGLKPNSNSGNSEVEEIFISACEQIAYAPTDAANIAANTISQLEKVVEAMKEEAAAA
ncbi:ABC transporter substrate-binding protein [Youxingia wuxianensis]|uniref:Carbohydrate ABC transporter substrate-binding protein n=1 Tax=Youxingia wuxianensis TaxID=2763678 RepID=A0A926ETM9_9FIRM|nr:ABC transporter substrate-binding protein [Youxingia wuxianensis]MBC8586134.1 carbohydrate ABC transporter substrate-binding protein [Youxingia wuxianensis]